MSQGKQEGMGLKTLVGKLGLNIKRNSQKTRGNSDVQYLGINFLDVIGSKFYVESEEAEGQRE